MSAKEKLKLAKGKLKAAAQSLLSSPVPTFGLPAGVRVTTNATNVARFPLPLTIGGAAVSALGVLALMRGHKKTGYAMLALGATALGAAAAAPELSASLKGGGNA